MHVACAIVRFGLDYGGTRTYSDFYGELAMRSKL